jgi:hypothetical protein
MRLLSLSSAWNIVHYIEAAVNPKPYSGCWGEDSDYKTEWARGLLKTAAPIRFILAALRPVIRVFIPAESAQKKKEAIEALTQATSLKQD